MSEKDLTTGSDFDPNELVRTMDSHATNIQSLTKRIDALEERLGSNEKIADTLCETADKAVKMREMLENNFISLLSQNENARTEIKKLVDQVDRGFVQAKLKQYGTWIGAGLLFLFAQASTELVKFLISIFTNPPSVP